MAEEIKDNAQYRVQLARSVKFGSAWLRPSQKHVIEGITLKKLMAEPANRGAINVLSEKQRPQR